MLFPYIYVHGGSNPAWLVHIPDAEQYNRFQIKKVSIRRKIAPNDHIEPAILTGIVAALMVGLVWCIQHLMLDATTLGGRIAGYLGIVVAGLIGLAAGLLCLYHVIASIEAILVKAADTSQIQACWISDWPLCDLVRELGDDWNVAKDVMRDKTDLCGALSLILTCYINDARQARRNNDRASVASLTRGAAQDIQLLLRGETRRQMVTSPSHSAV